VAGMLYWSSGDVGAYPVNPPLIKALAALPLLAATPVLPSPGAQEHIADLHNRFAHANVERYPALLFLGRYVIVALSAIVGWVVYRWARALFGVPGGLTALLLWAMCPNVLAWSGVVTADMGATLFGVVGMYAMRGYVYDPSWGRAVRVALALAVAQLAKFTLLVLFPIWLVVCAVVYWRRRAGNPPRYRLTSTTVDRCSPSERRPRPARAAALAHFALAPLLAVVAVNFVYEFQGSFRRLGDYNFHCHALTRIAEPLRQDVGAAGAVLEREYCARNRFRRTFLEGVRVPLPKAYITGLDIQKSHSDYGLRCYLRGHWRQRGWWFYYLYALAIKMPLGTFVVAAVALVTAVGACAYRRSLQEEMLVAVPATAFLVLVSSQTGLDSGLRYLLPAFPFAFISAGRVGRLVADAFSRGRLQGRRRTWGRVGAVAVVAALIWNGASVFRFHPHYQSYFNEAVGGPSNGWMHLIDSNVDWGQDLVLLKRWLDKHPEARPIGLAVAAGLDPHVAGVKYRLAPVGHNVAEALDLPAALRGTRGYGPHPGWFAVGVNFLCGMKSYTYDESGERLRVPRESYGYFRHFEPTDRVGYSILIYHVTLDEANRVRRALGLEELGDDSDEGHHKAKGVKR